MLFVKSEHCLLLPALLLVFSIFSFTYGASQYHRPRSTTPVQDMRDGDEYSAISWGVRRYLVEGANAEAVENPSMILAAERTHRRDLLENFRYYKGGWDIRQKHYLSSAGITGAPLFLIAAIWFLGFGLCFFIIGLNYCCCYRRHCGYSPTTYTFSLIFLTLFTVAAITGCIVLYIGQGKFHGQTTSTLEHVLNKADTVVESLGNVSNYLAAAKQVGVGQFYLPADVQNNIEKLQRMISNSSITLENKTNKNSTSIQHVLDSVRLALIIIATVMLLLALLGFLFSVFSLKFLVHTSVTMGLILVTVTFILCGIFLIFHKSGKNMFAKFQKPATAQAWAG